VAFPRPIGAIFSKIVIEWGSDFSETLDHYDQLCSILERHFKTADTQLETAYAGGSLADTGSMVSRLNNDMPIAQRSFAATGSKYYLIGLHLGHLMQKLVPMGMLDTPVTVTLYLNQAADCIETDDNVNPTLNTYTLSEAAWWVPMFTIPRDYANSLLNSVNTSPVGVFFPYPYWRYQGDTQVINVGGSKDIKINATVKNLKHVIIGLRRLANITGLGKLDKTTCFENDAHLTGYQADINGEKKPTEMIPTTDDGVQAFWHYLLGLDKWNSYKGAYTQVGFINVGRGTWTAATSSSFLMHLDFDDFEGDNIISGVNISDQNGQLILTLFFDASGPAQTMKIDVWLLTEEQVILKPSPNGQNKIKLTISNKTS
jgi:hypothetical protein